jgi:hypothetical protein
MVEDAALPNASCPHGDIVLLWIIAPDSDVIRRRNVEDVAARIFLPVERFAEGLDEKLHADEGNIAVVAVIGDGSPQASILEAISRFHRARVIVIAYADGVNSWPIGVRCRVLLAGAKHLLDAGAPMFEELLSEALGGASVFPHHQVIGIAA